MYINVYPIVVMDTKVTRIFPFDSNALCRVVASLRSDVMIAAWNSRFVLKMMICLSAPHPDCEFH